MHFFQRGGPKQNNPFLGVYPLLDLQAPWIRSVPGPSVSSSVLTTSFSGRRALATIGPKDRAVKGSLVLSFSSLCLFSDFSACSSLARLRGVSANLHTQVLAKWLPWLGFQILCAISFESNHLGLLNMLVSEEETSRLSCCSKLRRPG